MEPDHFRTLQLEEVEGQILYVLKAPFNECPIITNRMVDDPETCEPGRAFTGTFKSKPCQLGLGDLVHMVNLLPGKTFDGLAFAAGDGVAVLDAINLEAKAAERASMAQARDCAAIKRRWAAAQGHRRRRERLRIRASALRR